MSVAEKPPQESFVYFYFGCLPVGAFGRSYAREIPQDEVVMMFGEFVGGY